MVDRVKLREPRDADAGDVYRLLSDMRVVRYMLLPLFTTRQAADEFIREAQAETAGDYPVRSLVRSIVFQDSGVLVGLCGLAVDRDGLQGEAWYLLDPDYWGKGLTTEAVRQLLSFGFSQLKLHRIWATCLPQNPASARVLKKLGMRREGYLRKHLRIHGQWQDCFLYAMLREEWRG
jgi:ribosomal-protein-alanine N-acetyltransferase